MDSNFGGTIGGRKEAFISLVGSHNYNLNTPESDADYKVFVLPTFDDLYMNNSFSKSYIGEFVDYDVHDIRKCSSLWYKANVNFLEVLFSEDLKINTNLSVKTQLLIAQLYQMRKDISTMNLKYLYDACIGMHYNKMKYLTKGTEGTKSLVERYGFDCKQGLHSIRILDFLKRFADNNFTDFKAAIWYEDNDPGKELLLNIKNGKYTLEEFEVLADEYFQYINSKYKDIYKSKELNEEINSRVLEIVKAIVKENLN